LQILLKKQKSEFEKEKALLLQKIELMEMQLEEANIRENNLKRMHSSMLSAFSSTNDNESPIKSKSAEEIV
jgi:hypothetical protein